MLRKLMRLSSVLIAAGVLAACQAPRPTATPVSTKTATPRPPTLTPRPTLPPAPDTSSVDPSARASIRLLNAMASPLDVYLEGGLIGSNLGFGLPTNAITVPAGQYQLRVFPVGSALGSSNPLLTQALTLSADQSTVIVLTGTPTKPAINLFNNDTRQVPAGQVRLTLAHLLPGTGAIKVSGDTQTLATLGGFDQSADAPTVTLNTTTLKFESDTKTLLTQPVAFGERQSYLVFLIGTPDAPKAVIIGEQTRRETQVRAVNASAKLGAVDITLADKMLANGLDFGKGGTWQHLGAGTYDLKVYKAGAATESKDAKPLYSTQLELAPDAATDLILLGTPDALQHRLVTEDLSPTETDYARMIVVNSIPDANMLQSIRSGLVMDGFSTVHYGESSPPVSMAAGLAEMAFRSDDLGTPRVVENKTPLALKPGTAYVYIVTGTARDTDPVLLSTDVGIVSAAAATATLTNMPLLQVRMINAMAEDVSLDVALNGKPLFSAVRQGKGTHLITLPPQSATLKLTLSGGSTALNEVPMNAITNQQLTLVAVGTSKSARLLQIIEDVQPTTSGSVVRVIHAAPNAPRIRVETAVAFPTPSGSSIDRPAVTPTRRAIGVELIPYIDFSNVSASRLLSPGTYTFITRSAIDASLLGQLPNVTIEVGKRYDLVLLPGNGTAVNPVIVVSADSPQ